MVVVKRHTRQGPSACVRACVRVRLAPPRWAQLWRLREVFPFADTLKTDTRHGKAIGPLHPIQITGHVAPGPSVRLEPAFVLRTELSPPVTLLKVGGLLSPNSHAP